MGAIAGLVFKLLTALPTFIQLAESFFPVGAGTIKARMVMNMLSAAHDEVPQLAKMGADLQQPLSDVVKAVADLMNATGTMHVDASHVTAAIAQAGASLGAVADAAVQPGGTQLDAIAQAVQQLTADVKVLKDGGAAALAAVKTAAAGAGGD